MRLIRRCLVTGNTFNEILRHSGTTPARLSFRASNSFQKFKFGTSSRIEIWSVSERILFKFGMRSDIMGIRWRIAASFLKIENKSFWQFFFCFQFSQVCRVKMFWAFLKCRCVGRSVGWAVRRVPQNELQLLCNLCHGREWPRRG